MEHKGRRKIYLASFFIFAIVAIGLILFAQGYQIDFGARKIYRAGIAVISSNPEGAEIYINGHKQDVKTPATLRNLVPGDYTIVIKKEGYLDIEQHLTIDAEKVNYNLENLELFLKEPSLNQITSRNILDFFISPDQSKVIYTSESNNQNQLWFLDLSKNKLSEIPLPQTTFTDLTIITWSPSNKQFILNLGSANYYLGNLSKKTLVKLDHLPQGIKKVEWHPRDEKRLFVLAREELYLFNLDDPNGSRKLALSGISGLIREKNDLFGLLYNIKDSILPLASQAPKGALYKLGSNGEKQDLITDNLPVGTIKKILIRNEHKLLPQERQLLILIETDNKQNELFLIKPKAFSSTATVSKIDQNVNDFLVTSDNQKCIFNKNNELSLYDFKENKTTLITRLQEKIQQFFLHPTNQNYLYLKTKKQIKAIEQRGIILQTIYDFNETTIPRLNLINEQNYFLILSRKNQNWSDIFEFYPQGQK